MKTFYKILPWALLIIVCSLWAYCESHHATEAIVTPEKKGKFAPVTNIPNLPAPKPIVKYIQGKPFEVPAKYNQDLYLTLMDVVERLDRYKDTTATSKDSIAILKAKIAEMFASAVGENNQVTEFDNKDVYIKFFTTTQGQLLSAYPEYTIKPDTIQKPKVWRLYLGGELGAKDFKSANAKANLFYQRGRWIYSGSYDSDKTVWGGAAYQLFSGN